MGQERRRHERFPLLLKARRTDNENHKVELNILELSVGGCFAQYFPEARAGYKFRAEIPLLDGSWMPFDCKVRYRYMTIGVGIEFLDVTEDEQEPLAEIIMSNLWDENLPANSPFALPAACDNPRKLEFA